MFKLSCYLTVLPPCSTTWETLTLYFPDRISQTNYSSIRSNWYASLMSSSLCFLLPSFHPATFFPCPPLSLTNPVSLQTLQMGIKHFSGLFVMLCVGVALSLLTTVAEHIVYKLVIPRVKEPRFKYWLHTSQVLNSHTNTLMHKHSEAPFWSWVGKRTTL